MLFKTFVTIVLYYHEKTLKSTHANIGTKVFKDTNMIKH